MDINDKLKDAVVAAAKERAVPVRFSFWPNGHRREGKNDAQFTGRVTINTLVVGELLAQAIADGKPEVEFWADLWHNEPSQTAGGTDRPTLSGKARNLVADKAAAPADAPAAAQG
jgi:hypothetical protein